MFSPPPASLKRRFSVQFTKDHNRLYQPETGITPFCFFETKKNNTFWSGKTISPPLVHTKIVGKKGGKMEFFFAKKASE